ncbi:MAG: hypothetical protein RR639_08420 [Hydrogenoanaerobacterium sp.]
MKNNIRKALKKFNRVTTKLGAKAVCMLSDCKKRLLDEAGSITVEQMVWIALIIVVILVVVFPQINKLLKGSLDKADGKINEIWNYKG